MSSHTPLLDSYLNDEMGLEEAVEFEAHAETCRRCRHLIPDYPELDRARARLDARVPAAHGRPTQPSLLWSGPVVAVVAAVVVIASAIPLLFVSGGAGSQADSPAPLPGTAVSSSDPHVLTFNLDSGDVGWLLWSSESSWTAVRLTTQAGQVAVKYQVGSDGEGYFVDSGDDSTINETSRGQAELDVLEQGVDAAAVALGLVELDSDIPWAQLIGTSSPIDQWDNLTSGAAMSATVAENPLAASAAATSDGRIAEFSAQGQLVSWNGYRATDIEFRTISTVELQSFVGSTSTAYAAYLAGKASPQIAPMFNDALITLDEYRAAADMAITCVEGSGGRASFTEPEPGKVGSLNAEGGPSSCVADTFSPVDALWRLQVRADGPETADIADATAEGNLDRVAMLKEPIGSRVPLAEGDGWNIDVARRGEGWCIYEKSGGSNGEYCALGDEWQIPNLANFSLQETVQGPEPFLGITDASVDSVVVTFTSGRQETIATQGTTDIGIRGFGTIYEIDTDGIPDTVDLYDGSGQLIESFDLKASICERPDRPPVDRWCG